MKKREFTVIKSTLLGSILSNMLLVLGMSFFVGGPRPRLVPSVDMSTQHARRSSIQLAGSEIKGAVHQGACSEIKLSSHVLSFLPRKVHVSSF